MRAARVLGLLATVALLAGFDLPDKPTGFVNDYDSILSAGEAQALETDLDGFAKQTSIEIAVVTMPTLDGREAMEVAVDIGNRWGVGAKGRNNGVVMLFAFHEKKVFIATAGGIQPYLTDAVTSRIIRQTISPTSKSGKRAQAVVDGAHAVMAALGQQPLAERTPPAVSSDDGLSTTAWVFIILGICLAFGGIVWFFVWLDGSGRGGYGGSSGGGWSFGDSSSSSSSSSSGDSGFGGFGGGGGFDGGGAGGDL